MVIECKEKKPSMKMEEELAKSDKKLMADLHLTLDESVLLNASSKTNTKGL